MIDMKDFYSDADKLERGQTERFNHDQCPAGQDSRRRLYLTRPHGSAGIVLAFCHNCGESGIMRDDNQHYRDFDTNKTQMNVSVPFSEPPGMSYDVSNWPDDAKHWRIAKGLSAKACQGACIAYDAASHRVYLPCYDAVDEEGYPHDNSIQLGYQLRQIDGQGPKYYTAMVDNDVTLGTRFCGNNHDLTVLVEDLASAICLSRATYNGGVGVLCNWGVKIKPELLADNCDGSSALVWLDNDSEFIKKRAYDIARTWSLISGRTTYTEIHRSDPKQYGHDELCDVVKRWTDGEH